MDYEKESALRARAAQYLTPDEAVLWVGAPLPRPLLTRYDLFLIPFSLLWTGAVVYAFVDTLGSEFFPFGLFLCFFLCMGAYLVFGRFIRRAVTLRRTAYVLTDRKLLVFEGAGVRTLAMTPRPEATLTVGKNGVGTVTLSTGGAYLPYRNAAHGMTRSMGFGLDRTWGFALENVENAERVFRLLQTTEFRP